MDGIWRYATGCGASSVLGSEESNGRPVDHCIQFDRRQLGRSELVELRTRESVMKLNLYFGDLKPSSTAREEVSDLIESAFEHFQTHVRHVNITFSDVNGPKGGVDKQCRCVVHLKSMAPIVIQDRDDSFVNLLHRVARRAAHALSERIALTKQSFRTRSKRGLESVEPPA